MRLTACEYSQRYRNRWIAKKPGTQKISADSVLGLFTVRTQREVADMLGIIRQAVHEIEQRAFTKIRQAMHHEAREHFHS